MAVGASDSAPLYMRIVLVRCFFVSNLTRITEYRSSPYSILRELGESFSYGKFKKKLNEAKKGFNPQQMSGIKQRMSLLDTFLKSNNNNSNVPRFVPGDLTIVDLSDPFIDYFCMFNVRSCHKAIQPCKGRYRKVSVGGRSPQGTGRFTPFLNRKLTCNASTYRLSPTGASPLTHSLLEMMRLQRHLGMRVIISTQGE